MSSQLTGQSAYRPDHSIETVILVVQNDILRALELRKQVSLVLQSIKAQVFDTIANMYNSMAICKQLYGLGGKNIWSGLHHIYIIVRMLLRFGILYQIQSLIIVRSPRKI